jgi:hypothetical protein
MSRNRIKALEQTLEMLYHGQRVLESLPGELSPEQSAQWDKLEERINEMKHRIDMAYYEETTP